MIKKYLKKLLYWIGALLSDSKFASTRRFIGVLSFFNLMLIGALATYWKIKFPNADIIIQLGSYFFVIAVSTIVGTTVTDLAAIIKEAKFIKPEDPLDPFDISKDDYSNR